VGNGSQDQGILIPTPFSDGGECDGFSFTRFSLVFASGNRDFEPPFVSFIAAVSPWLPSVSSREPRPKRGFREQAIFSPESSCPAMGEA
jgi:hypothetical protein